MSKQSSKSRLRDVRHCKDYLEEMTHQLGKIGRLSRGQIESVGLILNNLRRGVRGRLGKRERVLVRAGQSLMDRVDAVLLASNVPNEERQMWAYATGTWKVIEEGMRPINQQAVKELIRYHDNNMA